MDSCFKNISENHKEISDFFMYINLQAIKKILSRGR